MIRIRQLTDADLLYDPITTGHKIVVPDGWRLAEDDNGNVCLVPYTSCATCKWKDKRISFGATLFYCANPHLRAEAYNEVNATLYVQDDFGCVQWEAREVSPP